MPEADAFADESDRLCRRGLALDLTRRICVYKGQRVMLSDREFAVLKLLLEHTGRILSPDDLGDAAGAIEVVSICVTKLRNKLEFFDRRIIHNVYGRGYVLE